MIAFAPLIHLGVVSGANASSASDAVSAADGAALGIYGENAVTSHRVAS